MNPQDVVNFSQWLQQILNDLRDTHNQVQEMRSELRTITDETKAAAARIDRKDSDVLSMLGSIQSHLDIIKSDVSQNRSVIESKVNEMESQIKDLRSQIQRLS